MNAPTVAVSSEDTAHTAQTSADHGRAENLVQETITRCDIWTPRWHLASPRRALLFTGFAWLSIAVIAPRFTRAPVTTDVLAFLAAAVAGSLAHRVAGRSERAARAVAAAVSCLRSPDLQLTAADQDELLATAEESLGQLSRLAATLLDVTRLQAGARSVFPRPADLEEIITCSLVGLGPSGRTVRVDLPPGLPMVVADPPVMERVIANITGPAFFDHVRRLRRPLVNSPKGQRTPIPPDLVQRPIVAPAPYWTWSLVRRRTESQPSVLAAAKALTGSTGID